MFCLLPSSKIESQCFLMLFLHLFFEAFREEGCNRIHIYNTCIYIDTKLYIFISSSLLTPFNQPFSPYCDPECIYPGNDIFTFSILSFFQAFFLCNQFLFSSLLRQTTSLFFVTPISTDSVHRVILFVKKVGEIESLIIPLSIHCKEKVGKQ